MIYPPIEELTKGRFNRYVLVIATAKCAHIVTDEYVEQREHAERLIASKESDKSISSMIKREVRDEKAVRTAIKKLYGGQFKIVESTLEELFDRDGMDSDAVLAAADGAFTDVLIGGQAAEIAQSDESGSAGSSGSGDGDDTGGESEQ